MGSISDKNIDALRIGIREQERENLDRERWDRDFQRRLKRNRFPAEEVHFITALALEAGDHMVATDDGRNFYEYATVTACKSAYVDCETGEAHPVREGNVWVEYKLHPGCGVGTGGSAIPKTDLVLVAR